MKKFAKSNKCIIFGTSKQTTMTTIIFKNESKAKTYQIISTQNQGCYKAGEIIRTVKTDNIKKLNQDGQYTVTSKEIK